MREEQLSVESVESRESSMGKEPVSGRGGRGALWTLLYIILPAAMLLALPVRGLSAVPAAAGTAPGEEAVSLESLVEYALENNPRIRAARLEWERVKERYPQARSLDDPVLMYTQPGREIETRLGPQERVIGLSQKIPFPGKLALKGEIVNKEIEIARTRYEKAERDLRAEVKKAYYDLYFMDRAIELDSENKAVLDYFFEISRTNYGLDVSELDELVRAQRSSAMASLGLLKAREMREGVAARINTLLDRGPGTPVGRTAGVEPVEFGYNEEELVEWAATYNDEVRIAGVEIERGELEKRLAGYAWKPDFQVGVNYSQIGDPPMRVDDAGEDAWALTLGVNIPIWFSKNRAAVTEKELGLEKRLFERNAAVTYAANRVRKEYFDLITSKRIIDLYGGKLIPEAKESVDFAEARYKTGKEMLGRLLETQSMWISFRLVYHRAVSDYMKSMAELERLSGRELTR